MYVLEKICCNNNWQWTEDVASGNSSASCNLRQCASVLAIFRLDPKTRQNFFPSHQAKVEKVLAPTHTHTHAIVKCFLIWPKYFCNSHESSQKKKQPKTCKPNILTLISQRSSKRTWALGGHSGCDNARRPGDWTKVQKKKKGKQARIVEVLSGQDVNTLH